MLMKMKITKKTLIEIFNTLRSSKHLLNASGCNFNMDFDFSNGGYNYIVFYVCFWLVAN